MPPPAAQECLDRGSCAVHNRNCYSFLSHDGEAKLADLRVMSAAQWLLEGRRQDARRILRRVVSDGSTAVQYLLPQGTNQAGV